MSEIDQPTAESDTENVEALWRTHAAELLRFATMLVGPADAGDVVAEVLLRSLDPLLAGTVESPRAYLYRAVTNHVHSLRRSRTRRWSRDLAAVGPAHTDAPDTHIDVRRAVARLTLAQRAVVYLVYWHDMTERDVAILLGLAPGTVHRNLAKAREQLRKAL